MIMKAIKNVAKGLIGKNVLLRNIISSKYGKGKYLTATALTLYTFPVRNIVKFDEPLKKYDFISSDKYYHELHELLHIAKAENFELVRIGHDNDGGYIMLDDFSSGDKIAYSFGIGSNVTWDKDIASRGYDVFMYDHTIDKLPARNSRFHFFRKGIADSETHDEDLDTLENFIRHNHHWNKHDMILKMDVEGAEWGFLEMVGSETLSQFRQIILEFHGVNNPGLCDRLPNILRKINTTHQLIHIHGQNSSYYMKIGDKTFCNLIEVTYARRDRYKFVDDYDVELPLNIDAPGRPYFPEVELGHWNRAITGGEKYKSLFAVM